MKTINVITLVLIATLCLLLVQQRILYNSIKEEVNYKEEQQEVTAGQIWLFTSDDPFQKPSKHYVFDVKDDYVLYRFRPDTIGLITSSYIKFFLHKSVLIDTFPLPCAEKSKTNERW